MLRRILIAKHIPLPTVENMQTFQKALTTHVSELKRIRLASDRVCHRVKDQFQRQRANKRIAEDIHACWPQVANNQTKKDCIQRFRQLMSSSSLQKGVCAVCAGLFFDSLLGGYPEAEISLSLLSAPHEQ